MICVGAMWGNGDALFLLSCKLNWRELPPFLHVFICLVMKNLCIRAWVMAKYAILLCSSLLDMKVNVVNYFQLQ